MPDLKNQAKGMFADSLSGLGSVIALLCAVAFTPEADKRTVDYVMTAAVQAYGYDFAWFFRAAWFVLLGAGIFYLARAMVAIALMLLTSWAVMRFGLIA